MKRSTDARLAGAGLMMVAIFAACSRSGPSVVEAPMTLVDGSAPALAVDLPVDAGTPVGDLRMGPHFKGSYYCHQGKTTLDLTIDEGQMDDREVHATFSFDYADVHGAYRMNGTWDPKRRELAFTPDEWTADPGDGWVMVGMRGTVSKNGMSYTGTIDGPGCTSFSVTRTNLPTKRGD